MIRPESFLRFCGVMGNLIVGLHVRTTPLLIRFPSSHRSRTAPCSSRPTTWNKFSPISTPTTAIVVFGRHGGKGAAAPRLPSGRLHGDRAQIVALADVNAVMT